jgi:hypothetical protein
VSAPDPETPAPSAAASTPAVPEQPAPAAEPKPTPEPKPSVEATSTPPAPPAKPVVNAALKKPPKQPKPPRAPGSGAGAAVAFSVLALLVAVGAVMVAVYALDQARDAKSRANAAASINQRTSTASPTPTRAATITAPATNTPALSPTPSYTADRLNAELQIPHPEGCASVFVDVDSMQVGSFNGHDFYFSSCLGAETVRIDRADAAMQATANVTPAECARALVGVTQTREVVVPAGVGTWFCLLTSKADATSQGIAQRLAIVEVRGVATDQTATISVSTYFLPQ